MTTLLLLGIAIICLVGGFFLYGNYRNRRDDDIPSKGSITNTPNTTNYNIDMLDDADIQGATPEEAKAILQKMESGDISLSDDDFYRLKKIIDQN